ncbi:hypothetical protein JTB14_016757 [Gonioctena quinquepunctata]|nr:hypothetical protein JTB14_016757 [Gonioctena quinquepunctata]
MHRSDPTVIIQSNECLRGKWYWTLNSVVQTFSARAHFHSHPTPFLHSIHDPIEQSIRFPTAGCVSHGSFFCVLSDKTKERYQNSDYKDMVWKKVAKELNVKARVLKDGMMGKTKKSTFYDIFNAIAEKEINTETCHLVLDGGFLIHRMDWQKEDNFVNGYTAYTNFSRKRYGQKVSVVFDGYSENSTSTKCVERERRLLKRSSREIVFDSNTLLVEQKPDILLNSEDISTSIAVNDADVQIVRTAIIISEKNEQVLVVGQDVDLLVSLAALSLDERDIKISER